jgi:hypothetical protein
LCDVSVLSNRVLEFATRKNGGCGDTNTVGVADTGNGKSTATNSNPFDTFRESIVQNPVTFLILSMMVSFALCSILTFAIMMWCGRRPLRKQRDQSELVAGTDLTFSECGIEEPEVVCD